MNQRAIFIDKDGTLIEDVPYNVDPSRIRLMDGALGGLGLLHNAGYKLVVVSNQSGVAHGKFREEDIRPVEETIRKMLDDAGMPLAGFYYCPHHPKGKLEEYRVECFCRKPNPGLLFRAGREHNINLAESWMVGDILDDMEAGRRTECRTVLINNGSETEWRLTSLRRPHFTTGNLFEAAQIILEEQDRPRARIVSHGVIRSVIHSINSNV